MHLKSSGPLRGLAVALLGLVLMLSGGPVVSPGAASSLFDPALPDNQPVLIEEAPPEDLDPTRVVWVGLPGVGAVQYSIYQECMLISVTGEATPEVMPGTLTGPDRLVFDITGATARQIDLPKAVAVPIPHQLLREIRAAKAGDAVRVVLETEIPLSWQELTEMPPGWRVFWVNTKFEERTQRTVAPGITYLKRVIADATGQRRVHIVRADVKSSGFVPQVVTASDTNHKRASVRTLMDAWGGVVAINGSFFDTQGNPQGLIVRDAALLNKPIMDRPSFALSAEGESAIGFLPVTSRLTGSRSDLTIDKINGHYDGSAIVLLTPGHPGRLSTDARVVDAYKVLLRGDEVVRVGFEPLTTAERQQRQILLIPPALANRAQFQPGERVVAKYTVGRGNPVIDLALQAGPMLVVDGLIRVSQQGDFPRDIRGGRAPRSAIGLAANGDILIVAVDGRAKNAAGATLEELGAYLVEAGAKVAMNLDGGSSTQLVINGELVTQNPAGAKPVANALVLIDQHGRYGRREIAF